MAQVVEHLPSNYKALISNPSNAKKMKGEEKKEEEKDKKKRKKVIITEYRISE
jgi:hypothetical protein